MQQISKPGVSSLVVWLCVGTATATLVILGEIAPARAASALTRAVISYPNANPRVAHPFGSRRIWISSANMESGETWCLSATTKRSSPA